MKKFTNTILVIIASALVCVVILGITSQSERDRSYEDYLVWSQQESGELQYNISVDFYFGKTYRIDINQNDRQYTSFVLRDIVVDSARLWIPSEYNKLSEYTDSKHEYFSVGLVETKLLNEPNPTPKKYLLWKEGL